MGFKAFPSFENASDKQLEVFKQHDPDAFNVEWVACEKMHGNNYGVDFDEKEVEARLASRNQYLGNDSSFHDHVNVISPYLGGITAMVAEIREAYHSMVRVQLFGELIGGMFPGQKKVKNAGAIMKVNQIYYCPQRDFKAFALFIDGKRIGYDVRSELFSRFNIPHVKCRARGKLTDLLALNPVFPSEIYKDYGMEPIEGNEAEGMVLEPTTPRIYTLGTISRPVMLKHKHPKHKEIGAKKPKANGDNSSAENIEHAQKKDALPSATPEMLDIAASYINLSRLGNVLSKNVSSIIPTSSSKDKIAFQHKVVQDAWKDLEKDIFSQPTISEDTASMLESCKLWKSCQKQIRSLMLEQAGRILEEYLKSV